MLCSCDFCHSHLEEKGQQGARKRLHYKYQSRDSHGFLLCLILRCTPVELHQNVVKTTTELGDKAGITCVEVHSMFFANLTKR